MATTVVVAQWRCYNRIFIERGPAATLPVTLKQPVPRRERCGAAVGPCCRCGTFAPNWRLMLNSIP